MANNASNDWEELNALDLLLGEQDPERELMGAWQCAFRRNPELGQLLKLYIEEVMQSLEGLPDDRVIAIRDILAQNRARWDWVVDWWYTKESLERIPHLVDRFLRLSPEALTSIVCGEVQIYVREATRCYLYELDSASVALSRSAIEAALNERLERRSGSVARGLCEKIEEANRCGLLTDEARVLAHQLRTQAARVVHGEPASEGLAFDMLTWLRRVLLELYADQSH